MTPTDFKPLSVNPSSPKEFAKLVEDLNSKGQDSITYRAVNETGDFWVCYYGYYWLDRFDGEMSHDFFETFEMAWADYKEICE